MPRDHVPGVASPTLSWPFHPHQSSIEKSLTGLPTGQFDRVSFSIEVLSYDDSSLYQVDQKLTSTKPTQSKSLSRACMGDLVEDAGLFVCGRRIRKRIDPGLAGFPP